MKKNILSTTIKFAAVTLFIGLFIPSTLAGAQSAAGSGQGLEISPPVVVLSGDPGQIVTTTINIRDITSGPLIVSGEINDFVANGEDGTPKILLDNNATSPYSIRDWISPLPQLLLQPKQIKPLKVIINVPQNASPGGYYGVIRFTGASPNLNGTGVALSASLGSLVIFKVNGVAKENLSVTEFSVNKNGGKAGTLFETTPLQFVERFKNTGNIHEEPTGQISLTDMFGNKIANINVNLELSNVLPGSTRKYTQTLGSTVIGNRMLFGRYTASLHLTYGANKTPLNQTITFWVIPYTLIGIIILVLIAVFIGLRHAIKRYNQHIRNQALGIKKSKKIKTPKK
jgi:hypothetical protein